MATSLSAPHCLHSLFLPNCTSLESHWVHSQSPSRLWYLAFLAFFTMMASSVGQCDPKISKELRAT